MKRHYKYEGMNKEQIDVLNQFTQYRSATNIQKRMGNLIEDESDLNNWIYDGYVDSGKLGNDHCSMGHALRYVHFAKNIKTGETIKFGIKCISDFFDITPDKLKMIKDGFVQINRTVDDIVRKFNEGYDFKSISKRFNSLQEKPVHYEAIQLLLDVKLPLPYEYEQEINKIWSKKCASKEFEKFLDNNPQYLSIVVMTKMCINDEQFKTNHSNIYNKMNDIINFLEKNQRLSENQIKLLNKMIMLDFSDIDNKIEMLNKVPSNKFLVKGNYKEYDVFKSLIDAYENWGLSDKQVNLLDTIYNRNLNYINEILNNELSNVE